MPFNALNFTDMAKTAYDQGRDTGRHLAVQNALKEYAKDPAASQNALIGIGAFPEAKQVSEYRQQAGRERIGGMAAAGDVAGARKAAQQAGDFDLDTQLAGMGADEVAKAEKRVQDINAVAQKLKTVPYDQRKQALQHLAPWAESLGFTGQQLAQFDPTDENIASVEMASVATGQKIEAKKYQLANGGDGYLGAFDPEHGSLTELRAATPDAKITTLKDAEGNEGVFALDPKTGQPLAAPQAQGGAVSAPGSLAARNNNPGNLRPDGSQWQGMTGEAGGFVQFDTPENGMRAARINLGNQAKLHGIDNLNDLFAKWAPASDSNDPVAYAKSVSQMTGIDPNASIDLTDPAIQDKILPAIAKVEGGGTPAPQGQRPAGGMRPVIATPGYGTGQRSPEWIDLTPEERLRYNVPDGVDAQKNVKTGKRDIGTNTTLNSAGKVGTPELRGKIELTFDNMVAAQRQMDAAESKGYSLNKDWGANMLDQPKDGDWVSMSGVGRSIGGDDYQNYTGSAKSIEGALLPIFSGASVTDQEAARYIKANAPEMGDTPDTAKRKSNNRKRMINATAVIAGKPLPFPEVPTWSAGGGQTKVPGTQTKRQSLDDIFKGIK